MFYSFLSHTQTVHINLSRVSLLLGASHLTRPHIAVGSHLIAQGAQYVNATRQTIMAGGDNCSRTLCCVCCLICGMLLRIN